MKLNKPKFHLLKNTNYAFQGFREIFEHEASFRIEVYLFVILQTVFAFLPIAMVYHAILFYLVFIPIFAELTNSAIERVVDLNTLEHHELAKYAKDAGSALVFVSLFVSGTSMIVTLSFAFGLL